MGAIIAQIGMSLLKSLLTEVFFKEVVLAGMKSAVKSSKNTLDDKIVASVDKAWNKK